MCKEFIRCILFLDLSFIDENYSGGHFSGESHLMGSFFYRLTELNGVLRISVNLEGDCKTESLQEKYPLLHMEQEEEKEWFLALQLSEKGGNDEIL